MFSRLGSIDYSSSSNVGIDSGYSRVRKALDRPMHVEPVRSFRFQILQSGIVYGPLEYFSQKERHLSS
jgi:hypothetical protein